MIQTLKDAAGMAMAALYILGPLKPFWRAYVAYEGKRR